MQHYDVVIIGSGPGGEGAAMRLAKAGKSVVMIEEGSFLKPELLSVRHARYTGLAVDVDNWIYLADSGRQMLLKYQLGDTTRADTLATYGSGGGTVDLPRAEIKLALHDLTGFEARDDLDTVADRLAEFQAKM